MKETKVMQDHPGRPETEYYKKRGKRRAITTLWPEALINYIDEKEGLGKRTKWLIEAAEEKMAREQNG